MARFAIEVSLSILLITSALAQAPQPGVQPFSTQIGGPVSSIDLASGAVTLNIPVRSKTGKFPVSYSLRGSSGVTLDPNGNWTTLQYALDLEMGKSSTQLPFLNGVADGFLGNTITYSATTYMCVNLYGNLYNNFAVVDPSGASHAFPAFIGDELYVGPNGCGPVGPETLTATDGSGFTLVAAGGTTLSLTLYDKSGNHTSDFVSITDPDGTRAYWSGSSLYDTLGTVFLTATKNGGPSSDTYVYKDAGGSNQTFTVAYTAYTVQSNFACPNNIPYDYKATGQYLPTTITTPTGATYTITYETTPGHSPNVTGRVTKITLPSGGYESFGYSGGYNGINCTTYVVPTLTHTIADNNGNTGTWTYVNNNTGGNNFTVTETDPANNQTVYSFAGEYQTQAVYYQGTSTVLKTVTTCYNGTAFASCAAPSTGPVLPITETDVYTSLGTSPTNRVQTLYDATYGNVTSISRYDWGASSPTTQVFNVYGKSYSSPTACTSYASGVYINDTPCYTHTENSSGVDLAKTQIQRNGAGHPTTIKNWVGGTSWLTSSAAYNVNGTLASITEPNTAVTSFSNFACNGMLPQTTTLPTVNVAMSTSATYDCNGGVKLTDVDANNQTTTYSYTANGADPLYRIKSITHPDGGVISFSYSTGSSLPWTTSVSTNIAAGQPTITTTATLDGLARTISTQSTNPNASGGYAYTATQFNNLGQVSFQYNPYFANTDQTYGHTKFTYDALGRVTQIANPDNTYKTYTYQKRATGFTDESGLSVWSQVDGLGRLLYVCYGIGSGIQANQQSPAPCAQYAGGTDMSGSGFLMTYMYDALGNLTSTNDSGTQTRLFVYDGLSRLIAERDPEITNIACGGGVYAKCYAYDSNTPGDLWQRTAPLENQGAAGNTVTTTYYYDLLHRLTEINYNDLTTAPVVYNYDETSLWGQNLQNTKGRMTSSSSLTSEWNDDVIYGYDPMGRVNLYGQCTAIGCQGSTPIRFISSYQYDYIGHITPTSGWNNIVGNMTMTPTYNSIGQLTELTTNCLAWNGTSCTSSGTLMTGANYNALGRRVLDTLGVGSGLSETWNYDVDRRGTSYSAGSNYNWSLTYNSNSTISASTDSWNGNWGYQYDNFNRLYCAWQGTPACTVNDTIAMWYSYDQYGNRWGQNLKAGTGFNVSHNFNGSNHITDSGFSYDVAGNLLNDTFHTYAYDAEGRLLTVDGGVNNGGETYNYNSRGLRNRIYLGLGSFFPYEALYNLDGSYETAVNVGTSTMVISNVYDGGRNLAQLGSTVYGTEVTWHLKDWLETTRLWINSGGTLMFSQKTFPWGEQTSSSQCLGGSGGDCGLTGLFQNGEDNTLEAPARQYALTIGSWLTPDPAGLAAVDPTNPQSWNRYAYVVNNPISMADPSGLSPQNGISANWLQACPNNMSGGIIDCAGATVHTSEGLTQLDMELGALGLNAGTGYTEWSYVRGLYTPPSGPGWVPAGGDYRGTGCMRNGDKVWCPPAGNIYPSNDVAANNTTIEPKPQPKPRPTSSWLSKYIAQVGCQLGASAAQAEPLTGSAVAYSVFAGTGYYKVAAAFLTTFSAQLLTIREQCVNMAWGPGYY
jgi:RHS repeat-associated protein